MLQSVALVNSSKREKTSRCTYSRLRSRFKLQLMLNCITLKKPRGDDNLRSEANLCFSSPFVSLVPQNNQGIHGNEKLTATAAGMQQWNKSRWNIYPQLCWDLQGSSLGPYDLTQMANWVCVYGCCRNVNWCGDILFTWSVVDVAKMYNLALLYDATSCNATPKTWLYQLATLQGNCDAHYTFTTICATLFLHQTMTQHDIAVSAR